MKAATVLASIVLLGGYVGATGADEVPSPGEIQRHSSDLRKKNRDNATTRLFRLMGKNTIWTRVDTVQMRFPNFHTQGLVKIGDEFYVSAVEVLESTVRNGAVTDALYDFSIDRSAGRGRAWLFKFDATGQLLGKVELTDGTKYHPGGIDYDGRAHLDVRCRVSS